ncbi:MAG: hypothetical protein ACKO21_08895 [Nodosilinea sp.]|jgi:hypothetical protein
MRNPEGLWLGMARLLVFTLVTTCFNTADAAINSPSELAEVEMISAATGLFLSQAETVDQPVTQTSDLTPQSAASAAEAAVQSQSSFDLTSTFGSLSLSVPVQSSEGLFAVTAVYSLFPLEDSNSLQPVTQSQSQPSQSSLPPVTEVGVPSAGNVGSPPEGFTPELPPPASATSEFAPDSPAPVLTLTLEGSLDQVSNAAAFLGEAIVNGSSIEHAEAGVSIARTGVDHGLTADLMKILPNVLIIDPSKPETGELNVAALASAILVYNQILGASSDATVFALVEDPYFKEISDTLKYLRASL